MSGRKLGITTLEELNLRYGTQVKQTTIPIICNGTKVVKIPPNTLIDGMPVVGLSIPNEADLSYFSQNDLANITIAQFNAATISLIRKSISFYDRCPLSEFNRPLNNGWITSLDCVIIDAQQSFIEFATAPGLPSASYCVPLVFYYLDVPEPNNR